MCQANFPCPWRNRSSLRAPCHTNVVFKVARTRIHTHAHTRTHTETPSLFPSWAHHLVECKPDAPVISALPVVQGCFPHCWPSEESCWTCKEKEQFAVFKLPPWQVVACPQASPPSAPGPQCVAKHHPAAASSRGFPL